MKKFRLKFVVSVLLVISMLVAVNSVYASSASPRMKIVSEDKVLKNIVQLIAKAEDFGVNNAKLTDGFKGLAYDSVYKAYAAYFEHVNADGTGWNVTAVYDKEGDRLANLVKIDFGSEGGQVQLLNGKKATFSKEEAERMRESECVNCGQNSYTYSKPSFIPALLLDQTASAFDWSEESQCGWSSLLMCTLMGVIAGFWTGFVCDVVMQWSCGNVPLS